MPARAVPLAHLSHVYDREESLRKSHGGGIRGRLILWISGLLVAALLYLGVTAYWNWPHTISSSGGRYFVHRIVNTVPVFTQDDPRWSFDLLGPTFNTVGQQGCALTSAAMIIASYGVDTDPQRLNQYLLANNGYTPRGYIYWEKAAAIAPGGQIERAYEDSASYALIDRNLLAGNPVIVKLTLPHGTMHFVVIVGKQGWDYLIQDPAHIYSERVYPLHLLTDHIEGLRFYRLVPPSLTPALNPPHS